MQNDKIYQTIDGMDQTQKIRTFEREFLAFFFRDLPDFEYLCKTNVTIHRIKNRGGKEFLEPIVKFTNLKTIIDTSKTFEIQCDLESIAGTNINILVKNFEKYTYEKNKKIYSCILDRVLKIGGMEKDVNYINPKSAPRNHIISIRVRLN